MAATKADATLLRFARAAATLAAGRDADALLLLLDDPAPWDDLLAIDPRPRIVVASSHDEVLAGAEKQGIATVRLKMAMADAAVNERLTQALLESVADELLKPGASVVAVYSAFDDELIDSLSEIRLTEHLGRLTARDLQRLETQVPLDTLKLVVDLAVEIGREGREGKPVGALFVVGDHRKVMQQSHAACFDFVKGYSRKERSLFDAKVREGIKEFAQLDGAFIVASDGVVEASCRIIDTAPVEITLTTGLGARHWAAAAITRNTHAVSVAVSQSSGTVRIFLNGEVVLRIEPLRRAMKWREFDSEPQPQPQKSATSGNPS
ncbi:MAG TPA: hypothetical protein DCQ98_07035 [Planctomycetaceae bacterium]|nr:hypothetical protein [Planctomycetaceae bacterium]HRF02100.1 diadenylate cyclase [Pirellulaceae bacterium]